jgi:hypothetical protein
LIAEAKLTAGKTEAAAARKVKEEAYERYKTWSGCTTAR